MIEPETAGHREEKKEGVWRLPAVERLRPPPETDQLKRREKSLGSQCI